MAVFLCGKCGHVREVPNEHIGRSVGCPRCKQAGAVHDTVKLLERLIGGYRAQRTELRELRTKLAPQEAAPRPAVDRSSLPDIDIHDTDALADPRQFEPIVAWFQKRRIQIDANHRTMDTTGFFDEVAVQLGDGYETLQRVSNQIRYAHRRGFSAAKITLSKSGEDEIAALTNFCQELHQYSFVAKYFYKRDERIAWLTLQTAPEIVKFFDGEWLEWYVFMKLLTFFRERRIPVACLRNPVVTLPNDDVHELDVFFLVDNRIPLCIECKTGEFRQDIDKFTRLAKRLNLEKGQFLVCATGLEEKQIQGFNSMYGMTFANETNFLEHVQRVAT
ncbi:MAG: DUF1887 family CARF protein [Gammaproteobacteria bacterium]|nr:DUF1887 family CARF protein [Gammaproteobacteria bacterium]